jgi:putative nucleotidyltransferase with HDIG domain
MSRGISKPGVRERAVDLKRSLRESTPSWRDWLHARGAGTTLLIWPVFALICTGVAILGRSMPLVAVGRVMNETATVRVGFTLEDQAATEEARKNERARTPRVYVADTAVLNAIESSITSLPKTLSGVQALAGVEAGIVKQFSLTPEILGAIQSEATEGEVNPAWVARTQRLLDRLRTTPLLDQQTWQRETQSMNKQIELHAGERVSEVVSSVALNVDEAQQLEETMTRLAREAGFSGPALVAVASRLTVDPRPTFRFDAALTAERQNDAAKRVATVQRKVEPGAVIYTRGEALSADAYELARAESRRFAEAADWWRIALRVVSIAGAIAAVTLAIAGYISMFFPALARRWSQHAAIAGVMAGALVVALWVSMSDPRLIPVAAVMPSVLIAAVFTIGLHPRLALALGVLHGLLVCIALDQGIGSLAVIVTGVGVGVWLLREVRDRGSIIRFSLAAGVALGVGTVLVGLVDRPINGPAVIQTLWDGLLAAFGGLVAGGVLFFTLRPLERVFDVTTAMTLVELRDPKHPLLRELQQRAPGTHNHSLNVANLAEAAAESIGANGLLAYVGSLYHDIGKVNKPDYFVENQTPGFNRHDRLSPAMSLLVIIGHVKDGLELAREFNLPHPILHFIEAHHGTTLVEYFYHRAKKLAAEDDRNDDGEGPQEIEYRYPGPKPRTKEVAILMLCDAVESAARSMANPTPGRIEAMTRAIASKRLMDGQFDECDLTLRELNTVTEAVSRTLTAIYHGRVTYPDGGANRADNDAPKTGVLRVESVHGGGAGEPKPATRAG